MVLPIPRQLVDGARTLQALENITTYYEHPTKRIVISHCGEYCLADEPKMERESKVFLVSISLLYY